MTVKKPKKETPKKETPKKICLKCQKEKRLTVDYYLTSSPNYADNRYPVCKVCIKENLRLDDVTNYYDKKVITRVQDVLLELNRPFLNDLWKSTVEEVSKTGADVFGKYLKNVIFNHKHLTWRDSVFTSEENEESNGKSIDSHLSSSKFIITEELIDKWGVGYEPEEVRAFERKYHMLKNNYQEKTAMHTEALLTYIRYRVKEELATAKGDIKSAKDWGALAQKAAQDAKINPSQLSKSDLSDGLDTFGQLVRSVEQAVDIIPILPQFKERPQDKVDFTIWCYINYIRDLKGLPLASYEDIYQFYEERKKEYETRNGEE